MSKFYALLLLYLLVACGGAPKVAPDLGPVPAGSNSGRSCSVYSVGDYSDVPLPGAHPRGDAVTANLQTAGWQVLDRKRDAAVTSDLFVGARGFADLVVYIGHGSPWGPTLLNQEPEVVMAPQNYAWASGEKPVRWFINDSCLGLFDRALGAPRWEPMGGVAGNPGLGNWLRAVGWGQRGMHAYLAHRAMGYVHGPQNAPRTGSAFAVTRSLQGQSLGKAWFDAAVLDMDLIDAPGLAPAALCAYDPATGRDYFDESLASPWPDPAPSFRVAETYPTADVRNLSFHWIVLGTPQGPGFDACTREAVHEHWVVLGDGRPELVERLRVERSVEGRRVVRVLPNGEAVSGAWQ